MASGKTSVFCLASLLLVSGCASIVDGTQQALSVKTISAGQEVADARCTAHNPKGTWYVNTPGSVTVHRAYGALHLECDKAGYAPGILVVQSTTKGMAFGNLLFGGFIGAGVDMKTGAAYNYPQIISVPLGAPLATTAAAPVLQKPKLLAAAPAPTS